MTANSAQGLRVWLITGASSGFGSALARAVLKAGDIVVAVARRSSALEALVDEYPGRAHAVALDVTDIDRVQQVVEETVRTHGRIDVLVNNAGRGHIGAVEETTDAELRALMDLHFFGPAALVRSVLPHMRERRSGTIVQMSSMGGRFSFPGVGGYSATKFALEGLSEALAPEVAEYGINVLVVEPGAFRTGFAGGGAFAASAPNPAYAATVGPVRAGLPGSDGAQPGDPDKAAAAILTALASDTPPFRLALGNDAADAISAQLDKSQAEFREWEGISRGTDFDS